MGGVNKNKQEHLGSTCGLELVLEQHPPLLLSQLWLMQHLALSIRYFFATSFASLSKTAVATGKGV